MNTNNNIAANCAISQPILYPEQEVIQFNGFAWSNSLGMIIQSTNIPNLNPDQWLGNQN